MDQHAWGKRLIHSNKHRKDSQLQAWNSHVDFVDYSSREFKHDVTGPRV